MYCHKVYHKKNSAINRFKYNFQQHEKLCAMKPAKVLNCKFCEKEFATAYNCKQHMELSCPLRETVINKCIYCREVFDTKKGLDKHMTSCDRRKRRLKQRRKQNRVYKGSGSELEDEEEIQEEDPMAEDQPHEVEAEKLENLLVN